MRAWVRYVEVCGTAAWVAAVACVAAPREAKSGDCAWMEIPRNEWKGRLDAEVAGLRARVAVAVALPGKEAQALRAETSASQPAGLYEVRVTARPSHVAGAIAFNAGLRVRVGDAVAAEFPGALFARAGEAEERSCQAVLPATGPLKIGLEAFADAGMADRTWSGAKLDKGGPKLGEMPDRGGPEGTDLQLELSPDRAVYYVVDKVEYRPLSRSGRVLRVTTDKIRYRPGEPLKGTATVADIGGHGGRGNLNLYLEHHVKDRVKVGSLPVTLGRGTGFPPAVQGTDTEPGGDGLEARPTTRSPDVGRASSPSSNGVEMKGRDGQDARPTERLDVGRASSPSPNRVEMKGRDGQDARPTTERLDVGRASSPSPNRVEMKGRDGQDARPTTERLDVGQASSPSSNGVEMKGRDGRDARPTTERLDVGRASSPSPNRVEMKGRDGLEARPTLASGGSGAQTIPFDIPLPKEELGYAVVAEFVSADGADRSEAAEFFTIAENFQRVALFGGNAGSTRDVTLDEAPIRQALAASRADYYNTVEYPFWAPDDLLALTPAEDYWFSGQANYHMNKQTLQRQIRIAHEQGVAMVTYGKWCVSGAPGWEAVYDRPWDFNGTYRQPIGSWDSHDAWIFDLRRNGEQVPYSPRPRPQTGDECFDDWWNAFIGITPNASLAMIRSAAEELAASAEMFGWDAVRWDGHIRAGWNATGRSGQYEAWAARQTQSLMRYFKDIMAQKKPGFRHGYNYFLIEPDKGYEWAKEDFELDELARDGGLLMNESIGNASGGWTFAQIERNLQVEGDLSRERGGFYLGISFAKSPRDRLIESALWAAAGCRPYNGAMTRETRRYLTRYAQYTLDERLRRLATSEKVLAPQVETKLGWQPFVYETPLENGRCQLVVNLLNLPLQDKRPARDGKEAPVWTMPPGTDPVPFALTLPPGLKAESGHLIDPWTLAVRPLAFRDGRFEVPPVAVWSVVVLDLAVDKGAPSLAELYGPPKTFGVARTQLKDSRLPEVVVDPKREVWEVNKSLQPLEPDWAARSRQEREAFDAMGPSERIDALRKRRAAQTLESLSANWWKGGVLPDDLKRKDNKVDYGDLSPERNGRMDIFYGRGAMDHRLRMPEAMARLDRFQVHDAPFGGAFRGGGLGGMWLGNNVPWQRLPEFDLLLFTGIPYAAIGIDNCYALPEYVKAGGAVFFTGGEWAFGKGGYLMTVLERDLLPVLCVELDDCRTRDKPVVMTAGRDFAELGCKADFSAKPSFWVYNQVLLKEDPGVKVFLSSDQGPVLVGWQLGKGRVACLLVDYRGKSGKEVTAFFDWADWPRVTAAVMRWLAPEAGRVEARRGGATAEEAKKLLNQLTGSAMEDDMNGLLGDSASGKPAKRAGKAGTEAREAALRRLLTAPAAAVEAEGVLDQLLTPGELPLDLRWELIDVVSRRPPAALAERVRKGIAHSDALVRQNAIQLLGATDAAALAREMTAPPPALETDARGRSYALVLALPPVKSPDLVAEGRRRVADWNASEKVVLDKWTGGKGFSPAAPELPGLDAVSLFQRLAWLAYLSRHDARTFGPQFVREWLKTGVYQEYCGRTKGNNQQAGRGAGDWDRLSACFGRLRDLTQPDVEALVKTAPDALADGLCRAHFTREVLAARNLLGDQNRETTAGILETLKAARNPDLAAFAAARMNAGRAGSPSHE